MCGRSIRIFLSNRPPGGRIFEVLAVDPDAFADLEEEA
jgi:hypothetical protein